MLVSGVDTVHRTQVAVELPAVQEVWIHSILICCIALDRQLDLVDVVPYILLAVSLARGDGWHQALRDNREQHQGDEQYQCSVASCCQCSLS